MPKIMHNGKNYSMGNGGEVDSVLSSTSENPIQNKVVTEALDNKLNVGDIADWAKADEKPVYTASEVGADIQGAADTALSSAKSYTDTKISDLVNGAPETLDTLKEIADAMSNNNDVVEALDAAVGSKANASDLTAHINDKNNPHSVTKTQIGLDNVENKSSETIRGELTKENITTALGYTPPTTNTTYNNATQSAAGLESAADKTKLDGIETGANKYSLPAASSTVRGGVKIGYTANGKNYPVQLADEQMYVNVPWTDTNTTYSNFVKSGSGAKAGLVPAPSTTAGTTKYLREDGTWQTPLGIMSNINLISIVGTTLSSLGYVECNLDYPLKTTDLTDSYLLIDIKQKIQPGNIYKELGDKYIDYYHQYPDNNCLDIRCDDVNKLKIYIPYNSSLKLMVTILIKPK